MRASKVWAIAKKESLVVLRDPALYIVMFAIPLILIVFLRDGIRPLVSAHNAVVRPSGGDFAIPAFTIMFAFYQIGFLGFAVMNEHGWTTWTRLRVLATAPEILLGKVAPYAVVSLAQFALILGVGRAVLGLHVTGSVIALVLVVVAVVCTVIGFAFAVVSYCRSAQQVSAFGNLGAILLAALGGAVMPYNALPGWARSISPATPQYWAMKSFRSVGLERGGVGDVLPSIGVLVAMAVGLTALGLLRFRVDENKVAFPSAG